MHRPTHYAAHEPCRLQRSLIASERAYSFGKPYNQVPQHLKIHDLLHFVIGRCSITRWTQFKSVMAVLSKLNTTLVHEHYGWGWHMPTHVRPRFFPRTASLTTTSSICPTWMHKQQHHQYQSKSGFWSSSFCIYIYTHTSQQVLMLNIAMYHILENPDFNIATGRLICWSWTYKESVMAETHKSKMVQFPNLFEEYLSIKMYSVLFRHNIPSLLGKESCRERRSH